MIAGGTVRILYTYIAVCAVLSGLAVWALFLLVSPVDQPAKREAGFSNSTTSEKPIKGARRSCAVGAVCP